MGTDTKAQRRQTGADYSRTVLTPRTAFPMKADLPRREPQWQAFWEERRLYQRLQQERKAAGAPLFVLHDGPPYANGHIHLGTALNKILKDFIVRVRAMEGMLAPYVPGWDTHGMPIEHEVVRRHGVDRHAMPVVEFRRLCREYALHFVDVQREEFKRLGVWGDWEHPYLTLEPEYEARQVELFGQMVERGYIYRGVKPVYWCPRCETALAEAEVEYRDHTSPSIYVAFPFKEGTGVARELASDGAAIVIWTTTPWTLPANQAVAVHPDRPYVLARMGGRLLVVAEPRLAAVAERIGADDVEVLRRCQGFELMGATLSHPLEAREVPVVGDDMVSMEEGSGAVHIAPGHGHEDYEVGLRYQLPVVTPVDDQGRFTAEGGPYAGMPVDEANPVIVAHLEARGRLLASGSIQHQYPHCWRCKGPVLFRATEQWFASIDGFRRQALEAIDRVEWVPSWGRDRIRQMVAERLDWCISRQRAWGVPIPVFFCGRCRRPLMDRRSIEAVAALFRREGSDAWFTHEPEAILPPQTRCPHCGGTRFVKGTDTMDVWFDSGSSHRAVLEQREELRWPADLYLEGTDQHRGWFQSSLLTAVATRGEPPYRAVVTHGFVVDGQGRAMHKSLGNTVAPQEVIERYGADVLRLLVAASDYHEEVRVSDEILGRLAEAYRRIRNTARFLLGSLFDFRPDVDAVPYDQMEYLDRWALARTAELSDRCTLAYGRYEFHVPFHEIVRFCTVDMGGFYLDVLKDRLYCEAADSRTRRSAQTALYHILDVLVRLVAPVLVHTAEEIWQHMPEPRPHESVHLARWVDVSAWRRPELLEAMEPFFALRREALRALEQARAAGQIGSSLQAELSAKASASVVASLPVPVEQLVGWLMVASLELRATEDGTPSGDGASAWRVEVRPTAHPKCQRCWRHVPSVGSVPAWPDVCDRCAAVLEGAD
ncbi:isoleucine--tRNA ligase [Geochorda subterranea]|uniref:Isoleucine--tRNA ligase n=1 Tax=Geochorda subterranea TaxID=3109564 RepID=A0ABZ1BLS2_9FIRM|nr:isoleucine--tRNA ligase [Limnochorda sp. LNt]WRP13411.1 isoleucine--tRNA ligase [Limnochorda sp. LNt]